MTQPSKVHLLLARLRPDQVALGVGQQWAQPLCALGAAAWDDLVESNVSLAKLPGLARLRHEFCRCLVRRLQRTSHGVLNAKVAHYSSYGSGNLIVIASLPAILRHNVALEKIWEAQLNGWGSYVRNFAKHLTEFQRKAGSSLALLKMESDLSDCHDGHSVTRVQFRNGSDWIYKPRSGGREAAWSRLLAALNTAGFRKPFLVPEVQCRQGHSWVRCIAPGPCRTLKEYHRLRYRTGATLYLAHIFRAVDLHAANFICHGEYPVLIDCETLFHPDTPLPPSKAGVELGIFRTGMLDARFASNSYGFIKSHEKFSSVYGRLDPLLSGFKAMHTFMQQHRTDPEIQDAIADLGGSETRYVYRPTQLYNRILEEAVRPPRLRTFGGVKSYLLCRLSDGLLEANVVGQEVCQLLKGDVPRFEGAAEPFEPPLSDREFAAIFLELRNALVR